MRLTPSRLLVLAVLGAIVGPIGDHGHVVTGTTRYIDRGVPFIWDSAIWFVAMVAAATVAAAWLRLRLPGTRPASLGDAVAAIAAVLGIYGVTALLHGEPLGPATVLVACLAAVAWRAQGADPWAALVGVAAAVGGTATEAILSAADVFEYAPASDDLLGVPPWLPFLYFAFGVSASRLAEALAR